MYSARVGLISFICWPTARSSRVLCVSALLVQPAVHSPRQATAAALLLLSVRGPTGWSPPSAVEESMLRHPFASPAMRFCRLARCSVCESGVASRHQPVDVHKLLGLDRRLRFGVPVFVGNNSSGSLRPQWVAYYAVATAESIKLPGIVGLPPGRPGLRPATPAPLSSQPCLLRTSAADSLLAASPQWDPLGAAGESLTPTGHYPPLPHGQGPRLQWDQIGERRVGKECRL